MVARTETTTVGFTETEAARLAVQQGPNAVENYDTALQVLTTEADTYFDTTLTEPAAADLAAPRRSIVTLLPDSKSDSTFKNVGSVEIVGQKRTVSKSGEHVHELLRVGKEPYLHGVLRTRPVRGKNSGIIVINGLGLGETIEGGTGAASHIAQAEILAGAEILTFATPGIGSTGEQFTARQAGKLSLDHMADRIFDLLQRVDPDRIKILQATSTKTHTFTKLAEKNIDAGEPVDIEALSFFMPAVMSRWKALFNMAVKFPGALVVDGAIEMYVRTEDSRQRAELWEMLKTADYRKEDLPVLARQVVSLSGGVKPEVRRKVISRYDTTVTRGDNDPLRDDHDWRADQAWLLKQVLAGADVRGSLAIEQVAGRGHAMVLNPYKRARKMANVIAKNMNVYSQQQLAELYGQTA